MIRTLLYKPHDGTITDGGVGLIDEWQRDATSQIWVAIKDEPSDTERKILSGRFGIHELAITDALRDRHPPKIEPFSDNTFILLKGLDAVSNSLEFGTIQLSLFLGGAVSGDAQFRYFGEHGSCPRGTRFGRHPA